MSPKQFKYSVIFLLLLLSGCNLDLTPEDKLASFDKLYAVSQNVEAVDFICKPDNSGYILIGNLKFDDNNNSDIIIVDVGSDGMQQNFHRIKTPFYDEAISIQLYEDDNSVLVLCHRKLGGAESPIERNLIIKSNLDGIPFKAENTNPEDTISAEFKILNITDNNPIYLNDFILIPPHLISVGHIRQSSSGKQRKITQIFDITSINFNDSNDSIVKMTMEKPSATLPYDGSKSIMVMKGNAPSAIYEVLGEKTFQNPNNEIDEEGSQNITWNIYSELEAPAAPPIWIGTDNNESFGDILFHSNKKNYIGGSYLDTNSIFLISKDYTGENNNRDQKIYVSANYGNKVASLSEDQEGNIIMATVEEGSLNTTSHILKFSQAGEPIENEDFEFTSTGLYNIKKIASEPGNIIVILSQKTFENNSTAIGLMKIKF